MAESWEWGGKNGDRLLTALGWVIILGTWLRDREVKQRLADVEVPNGIQLPLMMFLVAAKRERSRQWAKAGESVNEMARVLATRMVEGDERQRQLVDLQASLERLARDSSGREQQLVTLQQSLEGLTRDSSGREEQLVVLQRSVTKYTKWLLALTVVVAVIGVGSIATAIVVAATQ